MIGVLMNIPFDYATISDVKDINSSFASGTLKVMYLGKNRNRSHFSKSAVENALPSLYNVPIVCHWDDEAETIGGHDVTVVADNDGALRIRDRYPGDPGAHGDREYHPRQPDGDPGYRGAAAHGGAHPDRDLHAADPHRGYHPVPHRQPQGSGRGAADGIKNGGLRYVP